MITYECILILCTVISGALTLLQQDFNMSNTEKELIVGGTTFGAIFGGFFSGLVSLLCLYVCVCVCKQNLTLNYFITSNSLLIDSEERFV